jgi:hypothetical protein
MIKKTNFKAVLFGVAIFTVLYVIEIISINIVSSTEAIANSNLLFSIDYTLRTLAYALGGFAAYKISKRDAIYYGFLVGLIAYIISSIPTVILYNLVPNPPKLSQSTMFFGLFWNVALSILGAKIAEAQSKRKI